MYESPGSTHPHVCAVIPVVVTGQTAASTSSAVEPRLRLFRDVLDELHWTFRGRKGWLIGIAGNLVIAYVYFALPEPGPRSVRDSRAADVGLAVLLWALP